MGILKSAGAPRNIELVIVGESMFNDGVGVVIFSLLVDMLPIGNMAHTRIGAAAHFKVGDNIIVTW